MVEMSQLWALKRLNWLRCCMGCGLGWTKGITNYEPRGEVLLHCKLQYTQTRRWAVEKRQIRSTYGLEWRLGWAQETTLGAGPDLPKAGGNFECCSPWKMHCNCQGTENGYINYTTYSVWPQQYMGVARSHIHICIYMKNQSETTNCATPSM